MSITICILSTPIYAFFIMQAFNIKNYLGALIHHPKKDRSSAGASKHLKVFRQAQAF